MSAIKEVGEKEAELHLLIAGYYSTTVMILGEETVHTTGNIGEIGRRVSKDS